MVFCSLLLVTTLSSCGSGHLEPVVLSTNNSYISTTGGSDLVATGEDAFHFTGIIYQEFVIKDGNVVYGINDRNPFCLIKEQNGYLVLFNYFDKNQAGITKVYKIE